MYRVKIPIWMKLLDRSKIYDVPGKENTLYFTFDDGPDIDATPEILNILDSYDAKATFFCTGRNVETNPGIFRMVIEKGHGVGNHSWSHPDGWKTGTKEYVEDVRKCAGVVPSKLFRPPYGRLKPMQSAALRKNGFIIVMWSILPGDFDKKLPGEKILENITGNARGGSVIVLHDTKRFMDVTSWVLKESLAFFSQKGYTFKALTDETG